MTRQRTFSVLLAVAVALLGLDIALRLSPQEATAQQPEFPGPPEELFFYTSLGTHSLTANSFETTIFRLREDGVVEWRIARSGGDWSWVRPTWAELREPP